jgi:hypothetical protein
MSMTNLVKTDSIYRMSTIVYILLLNSFSLAAQVFDSLNFSMCESMKYYNLVGLSVKFNDRTIQLSKLNSGSFSHPLDYKNNNDSVCILNIEYKKTIILINDMHRYLETNRLVICRLRGKHYRGQGYQTYLLENYQGVSLISKFKYLGKNSAGKKIYSD